MSIKYFKVEREPTSQIHLRLPFGLAKQVVLYAKKQGVSINLAVVELLRIAVSMLTGKTH